MAKKYVIKNGNLLVKSIDSRCVDFTFKVNSAKTFSSEAKAWKECDCLNKVYSKFCAEKGKKFVVLPSHLYFKE